MKRILVIGLSPILGGVETYIYNLVRFSDLKKYYYDFLIVGDKKSVFEDEINKMMNDNKNHFYYCPNLKKKYLEGRKWLKEFYNNNKYDYIYLNTCTSAKIQYCYYGIKDGARLISHSHNGSGKSKINNYTFRRMLCKYSKTRLACSDLAGKWLYGNKSFEVIPNGIDVDRFKFDQNSRKIVRKELKIEDNDIIIGHVGRFELQKNHKYFIKLAQKLPNNYKFLLIGDGNLKDELKNDINDMNLGERFIILPSKSDIEKYYSGMDIFVMPSIFEGLPIVSVEAQANGLTCIFSDNVSRQSNLSNHCYFLALDNVDKWIELIEKIDFNRYDGKKEITQRKFDVNSTVKKLNSIFK